MAQIDLSLEINSEKQQGFSSAVWMFDPSAGTVGGTETPTLFPR